MTRLIVPIEERRIEIEETSTSRGKITINPCSGRVAMKVSNKLSDEAITKTMALTQIVLKHDFEPLTYRGKVWYNKGRKAWSVTLQTESKEHSKTFEIT